MNAPAPSLNALPDAFASEAAKVVPAIALLVGLLRPSPTNPRKAFTEAPLAELTESIARLGVLQPILVRPWPAALPWGDGPMPGYEIVAGERRYRAAKAAGLTVIPGMVRELTDAEVTEIQLVENLQREDLHPLEEAEGYHRLMQDHGYSADQVAEKIGKSKAYVYATLKLLDLSEDGKRLFLGGLLNRSTALLVARIPTAELQAKAVNDITTPHYGGEPMSVRAAKDHIRNRYMLRLADAPFPRGDRALVPEAGRCFECAKRTGNQPEIFADIDNGDVCTDPDCFAAKRNAHAQQLRQEAEARGQTVISGKEAKKIAPYGISEYGDHKGYIKLDKVCHEDPQQRTVREIIADAATPVLLEDTTRATYVEVVQEKILAEKLKEAGVVTFDEKRKAEQKKRSGKLAEEKAWRKRLYANIETEVHSRIGFGAKIGNTGLGLYRILARRFYGLSGRDTQDKIATQWEAVGKNATDRIAAFADGIATMGFSDCLILLLNLAILDALYVPEWTDDPKCPAYLLDLATLFEIDPDDIRKDIKAEIKAEKAAGKPAKPSKKPPTGGAESAPPPTPAAQAHDSKPAKKRPDAAYVHPENADLCWSGRGKKPKWVEHWLAQGGTLEQLRGAEDQKSELEKNEGQAGLAKGVIESDEEPTAADIPARLAEGDWVRVKDDAAEDDGTALPWCGQIGQVERMGINEHDSMLVRFPGEPPVEIYEGEVVKVESGATERCAHTPDMFTEVAP